MIEGKTWEEIKASHELLRAYWMAEAQYKKLWEFLPETPQFLIDLSEEEEKDRITADGKILSGGLI